MSWHFCDPAHRHCEIEGQNRDRSTSQQQVGCVPVKEWVWCRSDPWHATDDLPRGWDYWVGNFRRLWQCEAQSCRNCQYPVLLTRLRSEDQDCNQSTYFIHKHAEGYHNWLHCTCAETGGGSSTCRCIFRCCLQINSSTHPESFTSNNMSCAQRDACYKRQASFPRYCSNTPPISAGHLVPPFPNLLLLPSFKLLLFHLLHALSVSLHQQCVLSTNMNPKKYTAAGNLAAPSAHHYNLGQAVLMLIWSGTHWLTTQMIDCKQAHQITTLHNKLIVPTTSTQLGTKIFPLNTSQQLLQPFCPTTTYKPLTLIQVSISPDLIHSYMCPSSQLCIHANEWALRTAFNSHTYILTNYTIAQVRHIPSVTQCMYVFRTLRTTVIHAKYLHCILNQLYPTKSTESWAEIVLHMHLPTTSATSSPYDHLQNNDTDPIKHFTRPHVFLCVDPFHEIGNAS